MRRPIALVAVFVSVAIAAARAPIATPPTTPPSPTPAPTAPTSPAPTTPPAPAPPPSATEPHAAPPALPGTDEPLSRSPTGAQNQPSSNEITPALDESIDRGLRYLASIQNQDGTFGRNRYSRNVAIVSLAALAFMADGNLPDRGRYGEVVRRALDFVLASSTETGLLVGEGSHGPMYGHGFACLFLGEIYGMNPDDERVRDALVRAVQLIQNSQNNEGGWRYNPVPNDADVSVTICEIMGLRSARNAGIKVSRETVDRAVQYVRDCQNPDGGFRYMLQPGQSAWPRSAAGVASLYYAGIYKDDAIDRGLEYLIRTAAPDGGGPGSQTHYFYGHYYAVQAMYLAGGERWARWWPAIRDELVARQDDGGSWSDYQQFGQAYSTAMALIILQMPKRYLPIFQK